MRADVEALIPTWAKQRYETMAMAMVLTSVALAALGDAYGASAVLNFIEGLKDSDLVSGMFAGLGKRDRRPH